MLVKRWEMMNHSGPAEGAPEVLRGEEIFLGRPADCDYIPCLNVSVRLLDQSAFQQAACPPHLPRDRRDPHTHDLPCLTFVGPCPSQEPDALSPALWSLTNLSVQE